MTPRCAARLVRRWVRAYTRGPPDPIADRRFAELDADLHDQIAHGRARCVPELHIAAAILSRAVRGLPDDASWRRASVPPATADGTPVALRPGTALRVLRAVVLVLTVPPVWTLMSDGMAWGPIDFLLAGGLLAGAGATREVAAARGSTTYRLAAGVATGTLLLLVWALLAVGVAGREGDARDLLYVVVPCVAVAGAARARLRPRGMAAAMLAAAVAQAGVGTVLVAVGGEDTDPAALLAITGMFVALFLGSAGTFLRAARTPSGPTAIPGTPTGGPGDE